MKAVIELDDENGEVAAKINFVGGFDTKSHAHQCANLLIKHMDELAERKECPTSTTQD